MTIAVCAKKMALKVNLRAGATGPPARPV
jgi:hypothetical protein